MGVPQRKLCGPATSRTLGSWWSLTRLTVIHAAPALSIAAWMVVDPGIKPADHGALGVL